MSQLFQELKRRNVFRVAVAYLALAWVIVQVADIVFDNVAAPDWLMKVMLFFIVVGFPVAMLFAWAYEMTPDGIKAERNVDRSTSITNRTGRKLDYTIISFLAVAVTFLLVDKFGLTETPSEPAITDKSVAVLPFVAMSRGPDDEYFADGLTEEILNSLTRVQGLLVTARTSAFHFKGKDVPVPEIAAALGVAHIVEGSVRRDGQRLRVTAQLIRAADGFHLWSENYDHDANDTFSVQTDIAEKIATALDVVLDEEQRQKMHAAGLRNPEAFVAFQKGVKIFDAAHQDLRYLDTMLEANAWFEKALALEPGLSLAHLLHADYFAHVFINAGAGVTVPDKELRAARRQLEVDFAAAIRTAPDDAQRLAASFDLAFVTGKWRRLPAIFNEFTKQSSCIQPGWFSMIAMTSGRAAAGLQIGQKVIECDPLDYSGWQLAAQAQIWLGDFDAAIQTATKGAKVAPHFAITRELILANIGAGRFAAAEDIVNRDIDQENASLQLRIAIAAARGDYAATKLLIEENLLHVGINANALGRRGSEFARAGMRDLANEEAALVDARPYGYLPLMLMLRNCKCGAPFDLEATPNFAKLISAANLPWPPASPINWPLKDW